MTDYRHIDGPEPLLRPLVPGEIPTVDTLQDGHYIDPTFEDYKRRTGHAPSEAILPAKNAKTTVYR